MGCPAYLGHPFDVEAWVDEVDGRKLWMRAELREHGEVLAAARSLFLEVDPAHFARGVEQSAQGERGLDFPW